MQGPFGRLDLLVLEEFMIVAPGCHRSGALHFAETVRERIAQHRFAIPHPVTASLGVAVFRHGDTDLSLTNRADAAMYTAKENGRNRVEGEGEP